jgi:hypothetical protein
MTEYVVERKNRRLTRRGRPAGWNRGSSVLEHEHVPGVSSNEELRTSALEAQPVEERPWRRWRVRAAQPMEERRPWRAGAAEAAAAMAG